MNRLLLFTNHAYKRMDQLMISKESTIKWFQEAKEVKVKYRWKIYKSVKYGIEQVNVKYFHNKGLLYTVRKYPDYYLLLTITRKPKREVKYK